MSSFDELSVGGPGAGAPIDEQLIARLANELFSSASAPLSLTVPASSSATPSAPSQPQIVALAPATGAPAYSPPPTGASPGGYAQPYTSSPAPAPAVPTTAYGSPITVPPPAVPASASSGYQIYPELVPQLAPGTGQFDVASVRRDFPILNEQAHGKPLVWLDNAATTQKPQSVIDRLKYFYEHENSNIHRAAHVLAARSTDAYEAAREKVRRFLNAPSSNDIVFVRGATEAINLVAKAWGGQNVRAGDEIVVTWLEHHSNIVPWQQLAAEKGAVLRVAPIDNRGQIIPEEYERLLGPRTRIVALTHVSNALGTITPVQEMVAAAHRHGARVLVDGAQAVSHLRVDVQALDADFYVFSGHKVFGPTGIGAMFGKAEILNTTLPWQGGGNMIADVTFERTVYHAAPARFEAGTGNIADAVGLGAAIDYVQRIGIENITRHETLLLEHGMTELAKIPGLRLIGTAREKAGVLSFVLNGFRSEDVGAALDREGIAVRSGHHCAQPALRRYGLESTVRPSLALYNTHEEIDHLVAAIRRLQSGS